MSEVVAKPSLRIRVLEGRFAVCKPGAGAEVAVPKDAAFFSVTRTADELSVVCLERDAPEGAEIEGGWRSLEVEGPLDFSLVGVVSSLAAPLAEAGIPIFVVSTFETDCLLVKEDRLGDAAVELSSAGHIVVDERW